MSVTNNDTPETGLKAALTAALPKDQRFGVRWLRSATTKCEPLFPPPANVPPEPTRLARHFFALSINANWSTDRTQKTSTSDDVPTDDEVITFGMEVYVYLTKRLVTIFVSKADSTGYQPRQSPSPIGIAATTFTNWLFQQLRAKHPTCQVVISLFGRSQPAYLFPGSDENTQKHILDDRQLIKWWTRILDPVITRNTPKNPQTSTPQLQGYITVPGYRGPELRAFMPRDNGPARWKAGHPLNELGATRHLPESAPPRCLLPRFPDDPKARFILELDEEVGLDEDTDKMTSPTKRKSGRWSGISNLERFWEAMEFRQECSSGRVVGFLWVVAQPLQGDAGDCDDAETITKDAASRSWSQDSPTPSSKSSRRKAQRRTGVVVPRKPRVKGLSSSQRHKGESNGYYTGSHEGLALNRQGYEVALESLTQLDFANLQVAQQSTARWTKEVGQYAGEQASSWVMGVVGTAEVSVTEFKAGPTNSVTPTVAANTAVNDLGGMVRKKKRPAEAAETHGPSVSTSASAPVLTASTAQPTTSTGPSSNAPSDVNVLGASLIRKKKKLSS